MTKTSDERGKVNAFVCKTRRILIFADDIIHILVAVALLLSAFIMIAITASNFSGVGVSNILLVINDVLFVLIIMELLWTVLRYLRRQEFSLNPFIAIGVISSLRRILMLEAQMAMTEHTESYYLLSELGVNTGIVFVLVVAYYLINKADRMKEAAKGG